MFESLAADSSRSVFLLERLDSYCLNSVSNLELLADRPRDADFARLFADAELILFVARILFVPGDACSTILACGRIMASRKTALPSTFLICLTF